MNGETLSSMNKPMDQSWRQFTVTVLEAAWQSARSILFDLTFVLEMDALLDSSRLYATSITAFELRYLKKHWNRFRDIVRFYRDDKETETPW